MNSIQYNFDTGLFNYEGRFSEFSSEIRHNMQSSRKNNTAICHRVSFYLMAKALINAINFYIYNFKDYKEKNSLQYLTYETIYYILGIIIAVTGQFPEILDLERSIESMIGLTDTFLELQDVQIEDYQTYVGKLKDILSNPPLNDTVEFRDVMLIAEGYLNRILDDLNNEEFNLRLGNASWNSSVSNALDCFEFVDACSNIKNPYFILGEDDSHVVTIMVNMTKPGGPSFKESELFIYTAKITADDSSEKIVLCQSCRTESVKQCNSTGIMSKCPIIYTNPYDKKKYWFQAGKPWLS